MIALNVEILERLYKTTKPDDYEEGLRRIFFKDRRSVPPQIVDCASGSSAAATPERSRTIAQKHYDDDTSSHQLDDEEDAVHSGNKTHNNNNDNNMVIIKSKCVFDHQMLWFSWLLLL